MSRRGRGFALALLLGGVLGAPVYSVAQEFQATPLEPDTSYALNVKGKHRRGMTSVLVKLDAAALASYAGGVPGLRATAPRSTGRPLDVNAPDSQAYLRHFRRKQEDFQAACHSAIPGAVVTHSLPLIFGGMAMVVPDESVEDVAKLPGVERVYPDELLQLDTDASPRFIGAPEVWNALGGRESAGEGIVVGVLDSGVWPEHPSFSDPDPSGKAYPAPPASWTGAACQFGSPVAGDAAFACNHKLIGARRFMATYDAVVGLVPGEFHSARDDNGHGTHTASTAAGNGRVEASIFGVPRGLVSGMAPRAHVAAYKVCGLEGCYISDSAAAVQQAILDGVNVINFSISGGANPFSDAVELAFLDAYNAGVFVAASAGNAGPGANTTDHRSPWVTTVAASTQRRAFVNTIALSADGGASLSIEGDVGHRRRRHALRRGRPARGQRALQHPFAPGSLAGKIVVCRRGTNGRINKGWNAVPGRSGGDDPLQPVRRRHGPGDGQPLPARRATSSLTGGTALARLHRGQRQRQGDADRRRARPRARRRHGVLQLTRRPRAHARRQQARRHRPGSPDPGRPHAALRRLGDGPPGRAVPGDRRDVDVEPARRRRGRAAEGPAPRLDARPDQVRADDDAPGRAASSRRTA